MGKLIADKARAGEARFYAYISLNVQRPDVLDAPDMNG